MKKIIKIDGMACEHCVKSVKEALEEIENLKILNVKVGEAELEFQDDLEEKINKEIIEKLDDAGYDVI
ncbi:MAG: heavy-metal-associated domain-containing protein [Fusobacterium sp.]|nr:heavy-metal-associated domain-containing protein [Fusobacterium sp.]